MISLLGSSILMCVLTYFVASETALELESTTKPEVRQFSRTYDKNGYGDTDINEEDVYDSEPNGNFKGNLRFDITEFRSNYKGYPFYPTFKGPFKFPEPIPQGDISSPQTNPWMTALGKIKDKIDGKASFLSNLISDPIAAAALVPLSIMLASFVPVVMNGLMGGMTSGTQVVSTTAANKRGSRNSDVVSYDYGNVLEDFGKFSRAMDNGGCFEEAICRTISGESREPGSESVKKAASFVASLIKYGWINNVDVKVILEGLKYGNCKDLCINSNIYSARRK